MGIDSLIRAFIPALVLIAFALFRRFSPVNSDPKYRTVYSIENLDERFAVTQWLVGFVMLSVGVGLAWVTHSMLVSLNHFFAAKDGPSDFVFLPQAAIWWFLPGLAALTLSWEITLGAWAMIGNRNDVSLYNYWTTAKAGFDSTKILRIMAVAIVLPVAFLTALEIPEHAALRSQDIIAPGYGFSSARTYPYSDARRMTIIQGFRKRDGDLVSRAGVVLDFSDGRRWSSADISDFKTSVDPKLVAFLQVKTGLAPQWEDAESDIPMPPR